MGGLYARTSISFSLRLEFRCERADVIALTRGCYDRDCFLAAGVNG
jgi:hypothetical protein